jgi:hypothetical protein
MLASATTLDNFSAGQYAPTTASLPFSDNFGAGNTQGQLASTWATRVGDIDVAGGVAHGRGSNNLAVLGGVRVANATLTADVALAAGQQAGLVANYNGVGDNSMYVALLDNTTGSPVAQIIRIAANGLRTFLGTAAAQAGSGTLRFQVAGGALRLSLNGAVLVDVTDLNPLAAGSVGIRGSASTFANFTAASP